MEPGTLDGLCHLSVVLAVRIGNADAGEIADGLKLVRLCEALRSQCVVLDLAFVGIAGSADYDEL